MCRLVKELLLTIGLILGFAYLTACSDEQEQTEEIGPDGQAKDGAAGDEQALAPVPELAPIPLPETPVQQQFTLDQQPAPIAPPPAPIAPPTPPQPKRVYYVSSLYAPTYSEPNLNSAVTGSCLRGEHYLGFIEGDWANFGPNMWVQSNHIVTTPIPLYHPRAIWGNGGVFRTESDAH